MKTKNTSAFSLVELMISLITISCIAAAFTPVITKKLKKQDVALSLAQTSEITADCLDKFGSDCKLCTKAYCITCEKSCSDGQYTESKSCTCKNCSEHDKIKGDNLTAQKCVKCTNEGCMACNNKGSDEGKYYIDNNLCKNCGPSDNYYCDGITQFDKSKCSATENSGLVCVNGIKKACSSVYEIQCNTCNSKQCLSCNAFYFLNSSKQCQYCNQSGCTRCTSPTNCTGCQGDFAFNKEAKNCKTYCYDILPHCKYCVGDTSNASCTLCFGGYFVKNGKCEACTSISNCTYCDNSGKCTKCNNGYYVNTSGGCNTCTIQNCASCSNDGKCISCNVGYHLSENKASCIVNNNDFNCSDSNFMQIGNLCVTRKNMGDSTVLSIPSTVTIAAVGEYCYSSVMKCCWQGKTSGSCNDDNGGYSGCNRTVCNWEAAKEICSKLTYGGKKWRLATKEEMKNWAEYSINLGKNGLQLCDHYNGYLSAQCQLGGACNGAVNGCEAHYVWSGDTYNSTGSYMYRLEPGSWLGPSSSNIFSNSSVRCVTEME